MIVEYLWPFDSTLQDTTTTFNGASFNSPTFSSLTITGYGSSLSLVASSNQYASIDHPYLKLYDQSWTFEAWIHLAVEINGTDYPIFQQREYSEKDKALHLVVRDYKLLLGFYSDDLPGVTNLTASRWYHTAFMFDTITRNQSVYLNGVLDGSRIADSSYLGTAGVLNIGFSNWTTYSHYFDGVIDQLSFINRTKTSQEILRDATLTLSFSFDGNSILDEGPLCINGSLGGSTSFVSGRRDQALQINNASDSYFTVQGLVLLGRHNQSYSFTIWIKPAVQHRGSIIHLSSFSNGTEWCIPMLGMTNTSRLITTSWDGGVMKVTGPVVPVNSWTHAVVTYSPTSGLRLYVNGTLSNSSMPFSFQASGTPNYLFVGSPRAGIGCRSLFDINGQYSGAVDELQVYSRELTADDIHTLVNP